MCGIVGLISRYQNGFDHKAKDMFTTMLIGNTVRGPDSTGVFGVTGDGRVNYLKGNTDGYRFTETTEFDKFRGRMWSQYKVVIGHNRKATVGKVTPHNAHPFVHDHITLVHNGTLRNADKLAEVEVDSQAIASQLAKHDAPAALNSIDGAFAIVWYNDQDRTINLARNTERPLWLVEYKSFWAIASEPGLPIWAAGREGERYEKVIQVPIERILSFDMTNRSKFEELTYENYKHKPVVIKEPDPAPVNVGPTAHSDAKVIPVFRNSPNYGWPKSPVNGEPILNLGNRPFSKDDWVKFQLDDVRVPIGSRALEIFGHPFVGEKYINKDYLIKAAGKADEENFYNNSSMIFIGRVMATSEVQGMKILWVDSLREVQEEATGSQSNGDPDVYTDVKGNKVSVSVALEAVKGGCDICHGDMTLSDIPRSIVDTTTANWSIVCPNCVDKVTKAADDSILLKEGSTGATIH